MTDPLENVATRPCEAFACVLRTFRPKLYPAKENKSGDPLRTQKVWLIFIQPFP
jgi:hypothetical protein